MAGRGGYVPGSGRKRKAEEEHIRRLGITAIERIYGSIQAYYDFIANESKTSFPHLKLLQEYVYGKPKEVIIIDEAEEDWDLSDCTDEELAVLTKIHERQQPTTSD